MPTASSEAPRLTRQLGLWDATSLVVGTVIGAGIFMVPSIMARHVPSVTGILSVWVVGGILSYFGALAFAELGAMFPTTGGQYVFLREEYGNLIAFLCGWSLFLVVMPGIIAALATGFVAYLGSILPDSLAMGPIVSRVAAVGFISLISFVNYRGLRGGARVQNIFTVMKLLGIFSLVIAAFAFRHPSQLHFTFARADFHAQQFGLALAAALVAYEGWNNLSFVNGEILNPRRNIPMALSIGVLVSAALYILVTAAYLRILPVAEVAASTHVASEVAVRLFGRIGALLLTATILASIIGSTNGTVLMAPRLYFAQASDGLFFQRFAHTHPRFKTPSFAIVVQGIWASVLALTGSYELVATYSVVCAWCFYLLVVLGLMILRLRATHIYRPYVMFGYPVTPVVFSGVTVWFLASNVMGNPVPSLTGMAILLSGTPAYLLWGKRKRIPDGTAPLDVVASS